MINGQWLFRWRGLSKTGEPCEGERIGTSRKAVCRLLVREGLQPFSVHLSGYLPASYWQRAALIELSLQLASLLGAGLPLRDSLHLLAEDHPGAGWRCVLASLAARIEQGQSLSIALTAFPQVFPATWPPMVTLGEMTGRLDQCFSQLADNEGNLQLLKQQVIQALRYPLFVCFTAVLVLVGMFTLVLPEFARLYQSAGAVLPGPTRALLTLAEVLERYGLLLLAMMSLLAMVYRRTLRQNPVWRQVTGRLLLRLPMLGRVIRHHNIYLLFRTLAMTHPAGITLDNGLALAAATASHQAYHLAIIEFMTHIRHGHAFSQALLNHKLFPPQCRLLIKTAEYAGTLDDIFGQLAGLHEQRTRQLARALTQWAEPLLLLIVGGMVCGLVFVLYLPLLDLGEVMGHF